MGFLKEKKKEGNVKRKMAICFGFDGSIKNAKKKKKYDSPV